MEAQRENYVNQSLILRPDSIFAITCFNKQLGQAKNGCVPVGTSGSTTDCEKAIDTIATNSLPFYGELKDKKAILTPSTDNKLTTTTDEVNKAPDKSAAAGCDEMNKLWQQSQCGNFAAGNLPSLKEAGSSDEARKYPSSSDSSGYEACFSGKDDPRKPNDYNYATNLADLYAPMAKLTNATKTNLYLCQNAPYSQLSGLKCTGQDPGNLCWPGKKNGRNITIGGKTYESIDCFNSYSCTPQIDGTELKCKKQQ